MPQAARDFTLNISYDAAPLAEEVTHYVGEYGFIVDGVSQPAVPFTFLANIENSHSISFVGAVEDSISVHIAPCNANGCIDLQTIPYINTPIQAAVDPVTPATGVVISTTVL